GGPAGQLRQVDAGMAAVQVEVAAALGASTALQDSMRAANTSQQALAQAHAEGVALGDAVCAHALRFARGIVPT
ncbi:hypothetical protein ACV33G_33620, partial [Pseudomonas aeruginosa]